MTAEEGDLGSGRTVCSHVHSCRAVLSDRVKEARLELEQFKHFRESTACVDTASCGGSIRRDMVATVGTAWTPLPPSCNKMDTILLYHAHC